MQASVKYKNILLIIFMILMISGTSLYYFGRIFKENHEKIYSRMVENLAETTALSVDVENVVKLREKVEKRFASAVRRVDNEKMGTTEYQNYMAIFKDIEESKAYRQVYKELQNIREANHAEKLYIVFLDEQSQSVVYLVDSEENGRVCLPGSFDTLASGEISVLETPGKKPEPSLYETSPGDWVISTSRPVYDSEGHVSAFACVDIAMTEVFGRRNRILLNAALVILIFALVYGVVGLYISRRLLTKPLNVQDKLMEEKKNLERANQSLIHKARAAQKITELTNSLSLLFNNMPVMASVKDVADRRYLACNVRFAEYAHKASPEDVINLKDDQIFDMKTASRILVDDEMAVKMDEPYVFHEEINAPGGGKRHLQTTKLKFRDAGGRLCILGMSMDVTELVMAQEENVQTKRAYEEVQRESVTFSQIARTLSSDYMFLYYIDLNTDVYMEFDSNVKNLGIEVARCGRDFFAESRKNAMDVLYVEDQAVFCKVFTKKNILSTIDQNGFFMHAYRLMIEGVPVYMSMKVARMEDDESHLIVGVTDISEQMKDKEERERLKEEQITFSRISALSGQYLCIYTIDPENDHYIAFSSAEEMESFGLLKEGYDFFTRFQERLPEIVHMEDVSLCRMILNKESVMKEIRNSGFFSLEFRMLIKEEPRYVHLKAAVVNEKDGPQLIVGISDIDARVRKEKAIASDLKEAKTRANYDILTGVQNKHAYVELETKLNQKISKRQPVRFAVVICDVNGLKEINDTLGHKAGDQLIQRAASIISNIFHHSQVFRIGGDEFTVILQDGYVDELDGMMEEMAKSNAYNSVMGNVVIACGMSLYDGDDSVLPVFERADAAMYENKKALKGGAQYVR